MEIVVIDEDDIEFLRSVGPEKVIRLLRPHWSQEDWDGCIIERNWNPCPMDVAKVVKAYGPDHPKRPVEFVVYHLLDSLPLDSDLKFEMMDVLS